MSTPEEILSSISVDEAAKSILDLVSDKFVGGNFYRNREIIDW